MPDLTLDTAKNLAIALAVAFIIGSIAAAWIMKTIVQKVAVASVLAIFAFAVWSQRDALQDCASRVAEDFQQAYEVDELRVSDVNTECKFFGTTITIKDPRSNNGSE